MLLWPPIWPTVLCSWVGAGAGYGVLWGQSARPQVHFPATAGGAGSVWTAQHSTSDFVLVVLLSEYARLAFGRVAAVRLWCVAVAVVLCFMLAQTIFGC